MPLDRWPSPARERLTAMLAAAQPGDFAVFDADNTLWLDDVTEGTLVWLAREGRLTIEGLPEPLRPLPPRPGESIWSYYRYLCDVGTGVGYLWSVQVFAGFTLAELRSAVHALLAGDGPMPTTDLVDGAVVPTLVPRPRPYARMRELVAALEAAGVACWIVTASAEELVRVLACDPVHGLGFAPERVCGVNVLLDGDGPPDWGAKARAEGRIPAGPAWDAQRMTIYAIAPMTWYEGKVAGVREWIAPVQRPLLAAGDSLSDGPMQLLVEVPRGVRLRIRRDPATDAKIARLIAERAGTDAAEGWLAVEPADLGAG